MSSFPRLDDHDQAVGVSFTDDCIEIRLADGRRVSTPLSFYPTLFAATPAQREAFAFFGLGTALEWPEFDLQLGVDDIIAGRREHIPPPGFWERTRAEMKRLGMTPPPGRRNEPRA